jgi:peptidyl-prolyl cis-trans isomerase B (cyclophilin B)
MVTLTKKSRAVLKTSMGDITLEFLGDQAPRTIDNFVKLAHKGFYDGLTFHRIVKDFMVQGGCPRGDGSGGPGHNIGPEFNDTPHVKGVVSMARSNDPQSAGSQFFIMLGDARYLDHKYSAFAKVVDGEDVLDKIAATPVFENRHRELSQPRDPVYINRIELEGVEFDEDELGDNGAAAQPRRDEGRRGRDSEQPSGKSGRSDKGGKAEKSDKAEKPSKGRKTEKADEPAEDVEDVEEAPKSKARAKPKAARAKATTKKATSKKPQAKSAGESKPRKATRKKSKS